jgi:hypothetical protein
MTLGVEKAFKLYMALRLHFTSNYDVFDHKGRFKNQSKVMSREDVYLVKGLVGIAPEPKDFIDLCVANFLYGNANFLYGQEYVQENYTKWRRNKESITYQLQQDVNHIDLYADSLQQYMATRAISDLLSGKIQYESLIIIQRYIPIYDMIRGYNTDEFVTRMKKANKFVIGGKQYPLHREIVSNLNQEQ